MRLKPKTKQECSENADSSPSLALTLAPYASPLRQPLRMTSGKFPKMVEAPVSVPVVLVLVVSVPVVAVSYDYDHPLV